MIKAIATDLDGTLLKPKKIFSLIEKENKNFLKSFNGTIILNSGRKVSFCKKICNKLNIDHNFIALNGAIIVKNGKAIYKSSINKEILKNLFEYIINEEKNFELLIYDEKDKITCYSTNKSKTRKKFLESFIKNGRLNEKIEINNKKVLTHIENQIKIHKALLYIDYPSKLITKLEKEFSNQLNLYATNHSIEITPFETNKGIALKKFISSVNIKDDEIYVVGDSNNDLPMFELFKNSFLITKENNISNIKTKYTLNKFSELNKYI